MGFSLGLALYRLSAPHEARRTEPAPPRPQGRLVWLHSPSADSRPAMLELARRLMTEDGVPVLLTSPDPLAEATEALLAPPPFDRAEEVRAFLDHWRPEIAVSAEGEIRPALLEELARRRIPRLMVDATAPRLVPGRRGWFPGLLPRALARFNRILLRDDTAARAFRKAGAPFETLKISGPMEEASAALPANERDRAALAAALASRPVWLAAELPAEEETLVIAAHREALKLAHRLVLILSLEDPSRAEDLAARLEAEEGWHVACRQKDQDPDPETEVFLVDGTTDAGLLYRLAPVVYLGGGLSERGCRRNPMEAAALGSALILGPRQGPWTRAYGRLTRSMAARVIASAGDLSLALSDLLSPDRAARLAQAAWAIASEGAEVTEEVIETVRALMDGTAPPPLTPPAPSALPAAGRA
jgi:3-deoxy-D-manno-octulosonic-acid transferase